MRNIPDGPPSDPDSYLQSVPEPARSTLEALRQQIRALVPDAQEVISYQIPTFKYLGSLVGYAAFASHCSLFVMSKAVMAQFAAELQPYPTATATIRFPHEQGLPPELVERIVWARMLENEAIDLARREKKRKRAL
ncbi:MAG: DUF1801 domain-containing protein [Bacteroidia bacterium]|nr:DUF1801 domain-containing protein [Bacteroidia bacterium]